MGRAFDFLANCADGVFAVDHRQVVIMWNKAASGILDYSPEEAIGRPCYAILHGVDSEGCRLCCCGCDVLAAANHSELSPTCDIATRTRQGRDIWISLGTILLPPQANGSAVVAHYFHEVTRQHELIRLANEFSLRISDISSPTLQHSSAKQPLDHPSSSLTRREQEILTQLAAGVSSEAIAHRLYISPRTVRNHVNNILHKLGVHSRLEAVSLSIRNRLV